RQRRLQKLNLRKGNPPRRKQRNKTHSCPSSLSLRVRSNPLTSAKYFVSGWGSAFTPRLAGVHHLQKTPVPLRKPSGLGDQLDSSERNVLRLKNIAVEPFALSSDGICHDRRVISGADWTT